MKALGMRIAKLVLGLSVAQVIPEKIKKLSPNNLGFIDVNRTVYEGFKSAPDIVRTLYNEVELSCA